MRTHSKSRRLACWSLALVAIGVLVLILQPSQLTRSVTSVQWRSLSSWGFGWKRVAFCSEQSAAFRGWRAELGPVILMRLSPTLSLADVVQPNGPANESRSARSETNRTTSAAGSRWWLCV